jgi:hypothetical protein
MAAGIARAFSAKVTFGLAQKMRLKSNCESHFHEREFWEMALGAWKGRSFMQSKGRSFT